MTEESVLDIPIVAFPPFKLRSSLIDKDPVIWVHLLESYILLFQKLRIIYSDRKQKLSLKSQQQLTVFLKIYFHESAEESTKIFSLGAINPDIIRNTKVLKLYVFEFVKTTNLVNLNLPTESVWEFVKVYCKLLKLNDSNKTFPVTIPLVRSLVQGSIKSKLNSRSNDLSLISGIQKHLNTLIESKNFTKYDSEALSLLLGRYVQKLGTSQQRIIGNAKNKNKKNAKTASQDNSTTVSSDFASKFVNATWMELLEVLYNKGTTAHAAVLFEVGVISVLSLPMIKLSKLISIDLNVHNFKTMVRLFPLLSTIVLSAEYQKLNPGLEERLPFLTKEGREQSFKAPVSFNEEHIEALLDLFPSLETSQIQQLLLDNNDNVEIIINRMLETDPTTYNQLPHYKEEFEPKQEPAIDKSLYHFGKAKEKEKHKIDMEKLKNLKEKTLNAALTLLYEPGEDEPDDTYDDQEVTTGTDAGTPDASRSRTRLLASSLQETEILLFQIYKKTPDVLEKSLRKSKARTALKDRTKWSDEQIEGWARMLLRQPAKYRLLDEQYTFGNFSNMNRGLKQRSSYRKPQEEGEEEEVQDVINERQSFMKPRHRGTTEESATEQKEPLASSSSSKNNRRYDAKNKLSRANHNRKSGHDKKMAKGLM